VEIKNIYIHIFRVRAFTLDLCTFGSLCVIVEWQDDAKFLLWPVNHNTLSLTHTYVHTYIIQFAELRAIFLASSRSIEQKSVLKILIESLSSCLYNPSFKIHKCLQWESRAHISEYLWERHDDVRTRSTYKCAHAHSSRMDVK